MSDATNADGEVPHAKDDDVDVPDARAEKRRKSQLTDEGLEETFPASDPPAGKHFT